MQTDEVKSGQVWESPRGQRFRVLYVHQQDVGISASDGGMVQIPMARVLAEWRLVGRTESGHTRAAR